MLMEILLPSALEAVCSNEGQQFTARRQVSYSLYPRCLCDHVCWLTGHEVKGLHLKPVGDVPPGPGPSAAPAERPQERGRGRTWLPGENWQPAALLFHLWGIKDCLYATGRREKDLKLSHRWCSSLKVWLISSGGNENASTLEGPKFSIKNLWEWSDKGCWRHFCLIKINFFF